MKLPKASFFKKVLKEARSSRSLSTYNNVQNELRGLDISLEYSLIKEKKSTLPARIRKIVVLKYEKELEEKKNGKSAKPGKKPKRQKLHNGVQQMDGKVEAVPDSGDSLDAV